MKHVTEEQLQLARSTPDCFVTDLGDQKYLVAWGESVRKGVIVTTEPEPAPPPKKKTRAEKRVDALLEQIKGAVG